MIAAGSKISSAIIVDESELADALLVASKICHFLTRH